MKVHFSSHGFDVLLALGGALPPKEFFQRSSNIPVMAADGAAFALAKHGVDVQAIVGDFDSLSYKCRALPELEHAVYITDRGQETNDFEKLLNYAIKQGKKSFLLCGFQGGELEHTLNNWSVLMKISEEYSENLFFCIYDNGRYTMPIRKSIEISLYSGEIISLIPQPFARLTTHGLAWQLRNEELRLGQREGARNRVVDSNVSIELHEGSYLLCCNDRLPLAPSFE